MKRIDIKIHYFCNNNCLFCIQEDNKKKYFKNGLSFVEIKKKLEKGRDIGAEEVIFTGGEPTLDFYKLLNSIDYAKEMGYKSVFLQTNGRIFSYRKFAKIIAEFGLDKATISIHGSSPQKHDKITRSPGSFNQAIAAIKNLKREKINVSVNSVIIKENVSDLKNIAKIVTSLNVDQSQFAFVHMSNSVLNDKERTRKIVPKKAMIIQSLLEAISVVENAGIEVKTEGIPFCLLKEGEKYIGDSYKILPQTSIFEYQKDDLYGKRTLVSEGRAKRDLCKECKLNDLCIGPWREYPQFFGWDEFIPIKNEKI
jgi:MoaA/NifB/PqqE/SkfB family radical SAM enzyme